MPKFFVERKFTPGKSFGLHIISGHVSGSMQRKSRFWPLLTQQTHINPPESFYAETMSEWNAKIMFFLLFLSIPYSRLWVSVIFLLQCIWYMFRYKHIYCSLGIYIYIIYIIHKICVCMYYIYIMYE